VPKPPSSPPIQKLTVIQLFRQPHFSPFKSFLRRELKLGVMLNPKVGSTAFRRLVVAGLSQSGQAPRLGPWWPMNRTRRYTTATPADFFHAFRRAEDYDFRCFVRNPYARLLSAWNDKLVKGFHAEVYPRSMRRLVPRLRRWAARQDLPGADADAPFPFASFVAFIESQPEGSRNQHWDTQTSVLLARHIPYRRTYRMESEFVLGMTEILGRLGIPDLWTRDQLQRPTNASGPVTEAAYDAALADRVYRIYREDFDRFGYDRDSWQALPSPS